MSVVVTGGLGFIGRHVTEELLKEGYTVKVIDSLTYKQPNEVNNPNGRKVTIHNYDITNHEELQSALKDAKYVIHLAAMSPADLVDKNPMKSFDVNVRAFNDLLEIAAKNGVHKVVYASTSTMYQGLAPPFFEYQNVKPKSLYSMQFHIREKIASTYSFKYPQLDLMGLRFFSVYGPYEEFKGKYANIVSQLIWAGLKKETFDIYGDGRQGRDITYVKDVANAVVVALKNPQRWGLFNIGTGVETSINDIVKEVRKHVPVNTRYVPNITQYYVDRHKASTQLAEERLGFRPKYGLEEGIALTYHYYKKLLRKDSDELLPYMKSY